MPYGIITNCAAVFLGGILGAVLKNYFPQKLKEALPNIDRKSTRLNSSHITRSRMPSSA